MVLSDEHCAFVVVTLNFGNVTTFCIRKPFTGEILTLNPLRKRLQIKKPFEKGTMSGSTNEVYCSKPVNVS